ncbi:MAG TPA: phosphatidylglycerophosphatase A [Blastocatellia bacterium]|nr:phosphatidylglycerophosphatase A [Blastocatellia bacterium]
MVETQKPDASALDRAAYLIATGAGVGFAPVAPGTFGAIEALAIFIATSALMADSPRSHLLLLIALNIVIFAIGVWSASRACRISNLEDPSQVVIDEVSGQLIALTPVALAPSVAGVIVAFVLFRLFDIFKPYPIRRLERLRAGWGVMSDDGLAGIYAAALAGLALWLRLI